MARRIIWRGGSGSGPGITPVGLFAASPFAQAPWYLAENSLSTRCSEYMSAMYKRKVNLKSITSMKKRLLIADAKDKARPP